ncbi:uncharacterized protein LOC110856018 [Folsomia candida]|uniref:uncharacterized protein LOC110856018 n=1 Tax=Folsomia candida TaxID=158441 RepID=UPI000B8EF7B9|nr:uncharacterized protein LOC110856018 [Folsomia candida]
MCITTLKGGCYFAATVHIADALFLFWTFIFDIIHVNKLWWYGPVDDDPNLTWYFVMIGIYIVAAILLGFVIFRGIEVEETRIILVAAGIFLILQIIAFITTWCWWYPIPPLEDPFGLLESSRIGRFVVRTFATIGYMIVLAFYVRHLRIKLELEERHAVFGYRKPRPVV